MNATSLRLFWVLCSMLICQLASAATHTLTINTNGSGTVSRNPTNSAYPNGVVVTITALPANGWAFTTWSGDASGSLNPLNVTMDADKIITASFAQIPSYTLTVNVSGPGSVSPSGGSYLSNSLVSLTATPSNTWSFDHWSGDASGSANPLGFNLNSNRIVTAHFVRPAVITVQPVGAVVNAGASGSLYVGAIGSAPLSYQWLFNGAVLGGATAATLSFNNVQSSQAGDCRVVVTNPYRSETSHVATLVVLCPGTNTVTVCTDAALRDAVAIGGHVRFCCNGTITLTNTLTVTKDVTLDAAGQNVVISGAGVVRLFTVNTGVVFQATNLFLANGGNATNGGAAVRNLGGTVRLVSCVLSNHLVSGEPAHGGAVYNAAGYLDFSQCLFVNNLASSPFGGGGQARGGAIHSTGGSLSLVNCAFTSNTVFCALSSNPAGLCAGGALYLADTLATISATTFSANSATSPSDTGGSQSAAGVFGGAIYIQSGTVTLDHVQLLTNAATGGYARNNLPSSAQGGAIYNAGTLRVKTSRISGNAATAGGGTTAARGYGGGIYNTGQLAMTGVTLDQNLVSGGLGRSAGGGAGFAGADALGGGIYSSGTCFATNCTLTANTSIGGNRGGAGDVAPLRAGNAYGGGIFQDGGTSLLLHVTVATNFAQGGGGFAGFAGGLALGANTAVTNGTFTLRSSILAGVSNNA